METSKLTPPIYLPYWNSSARSIRFLYLANNRSFRICKHFEAKKSMVPLFLGADLFSKTKIRIENHPKYHAKFARKGLATKLNFSSDFRFHGLKVTNASNGLWFYSIQGLFRVVFELYSQQEQLSVLETFQDLWKSRIDDNPLNLCYHLSLQLDGLHPAEVTEMHNKELQLRLNPFTVLGPCAPKSPPTAHGSSTVLLRDKSLPARSSTADHDYCCPSALPPQSYTLHRISQKLKGLGVLLQGSTGDIGKEQQETIMVLLEHIEGFVRQGLDERGLSAIVLRLLETKAQGIREGDSVYCSPLLHAVSSWLGQQFHVANSSISQQVEGFKMRHIDRITDLPPAEELVGELFPKAMQVLLLNWMGLSKASSLAKLHSEYPILLLILEFANHNLITGVAHVLYSSLILK